MSGSVVLGVFGSAASINHDTDSRGLGSGVSFGSNGEAIGQNSDLAAGGGVSKASLEVKGTGASDLEGDQKTNRKRASEAKGRRDTLLKRPVLNWDLEINRKAMLPLLYGIQENLTKRKVCLNDTKAR